MKKILLAPALLLLFSCAGFQFGSKFSPVYVTNSARYALLPAEKMDGEIDAPQKMSARFGGQQFDCEAYVISDKERLSLTFFNGFGATMASLFFDGERLEFESTFFPEGLRAEYIVADFQFCLYDARSVREALEKIGVDFELSVFSGADGGFREIRRLLKDGEEISVITKNFSTEDGVKKLSSIRYENFLRGYSYLLTIL